MLHWHHTVIGIFTGLLFGYIIGVHVGTMV